MRPTRKARKRPWCTSWRTVSALQSHRSASVSGVKGRDGSAMPSILVGVELVCPGHDYPERPQVVNDLDRVAVFVQDIA